ncbi:MAG: hypothetical protein H6727_04575 [Myxococcales bacterium]|nr:hypothetical protein [Myxococcales bacterium]
MEVLGIVVIASVLIVGYRAWNKRRAYQGYLAKREDLEGHSPKEPWTILQHKDMEIYAKRERCHCGGKVYSRAEYPLEDYPHVRVLVCECVRCEEVIRLYFQREYLQ